MKNFKYIFFLLLTLVAVSCKDDYDQEETFTDGSDVRLINAATNLFVTPFNIYQNNNKIVNSLLYKEDSKYFRLSQGNQNFSLTKTNGIAETPVLNINENLELNKNYSYFLINNDVNSDALGYVKVLDDLSVPSFQKSKVRVANMIPDLSSNVDVKIAGSVVASNIGFKQVTEFFTMNSSDKVEIVYTGTNTVVKPTTGSYVSKGIYTLVLMGESSGSPIITIERINHSL